jgi:hypothetical protein
LGADWYNEAKTLLLAVLVCVMLVALNPLIAMDDVPMLLFVRCIILLLLIMRGD